MDEYHTISFSFLSLNYGEKEFLLLSFHGLVLFL